MIINDIAMICDDNKSSNNIDFNNDNANDTPLMVSTSRTMLTVIMVTGTNIKNSTNTVLPHLAMAMLIMTLIIRWFHDDNGNCKI